MNTSTRMTNEQMDAKIGALSNILNDDIFEGCPDFVTDPDQSYAVATSIAILVGVYARLFHDISPELTILFKTMINGKIDAAMTADI